MRFKVIIVLLITLKLTIGSRILFLFTTPSKSHMMIVHVLSTALAEKGHNVTVVSPFPLNKKIENHREIQFTLSEETMLSETAHIKDSSQKLFTLISNLAQRSYNMARDIMSSKNFKDILNEQFDLLIIGVNFHNYLMGFGEHFDCPVIMLSVQRHMTFTNLLVGNPMSFSSVPHYAIPKKELNFSDKLKSLFYYGTELLIYEFLSYHQKVIYKKYFPTPPYRSYNDAMKNISLILVNDHFSGGVVRPNVPAVVDIRGIQVKFVPDKLPDDLQQFFDHAAEGVIYFSLGSKIKAEIISEEILKTILSAFSKVQQKIIMKWDNENIDGISDNVLVKKWVPQDDILQHPNMKLFISHCGLGSIVESKYHGVPILAFPVFGDQMLNAQIAVEEGWALKMDLKTLNSNKLYETIQEMIHNEKYSSTAKSYSRLFRDRPLSPRDTAVYWTEYVINHRGAKHMQYAAVHQNFWQRNSLDVIGFLLFCLFVLVQILKIVFHAIKKIVIKFVNRGELDNEIKKCQ